MAAFNIQDASAWKEALEQVIDQVNILTSFKTWFLDELRVTNQ